MITAWVTQSCIPRRPKPPPKCSLYTSHCEAGKPAASDVAASAASPFWVAVQTSQRCGVHFTVAFMVSIVTWCWCGQEYTASTLRADAAIAARASPSCRPTTASSAFNAAFSVASTSALESLAFGPKSHTIGSASNAVLARHQVSATTATAVSPTCITFFTPGRFSIALASKLFSLPPNTGQSLIAALSIPGKLTSIP